MPAWEKAVAWSVELNNQEAPRVDTSSSGIASGSLSSEISTTCVTQSTSFFAQTE